MKKRKEKREGRKTERATNRTSPTTSTAAQHHHDERSLANMAYMKLIYINKLSTISRSIRQRKNKNFIYVLNFFYNFSIHSILSLEKEKERERKRRCKFQIIS